MKRKQQSSSFVIILAVVFGAILCMYFGASVFNISFFTPSHTPTDPIHSGVTHTGSDTTTDVCDINLYEPVCASDGREYRNACLASRSSATVIFHGRCQDMDENEEIIYNTWATTEEEEENTETPEETQTTTPEETGETGETEQNTQSENTASFDDYSTGAYHHYTNEHLEYSFAMPNYSYYQGQGAQDGANHTMAIATTASGIELFETAPVQVYFYKTAPANAPSTLSATVPSGVVYVKTYGDLTEREQRIVDTILQSAH